MQKLLAYALVVFLLAAPCVRADDTSNELDRSLTIENEGGTSVEIRSDRKVSSSNEETLRFTVDVGGDLEIKLRYESSSNGNAEFSIHFRDLIYYAENNSSPGWQSGEEISDVQFGSMSWNPMRVNQTTNGYDVTASTQAGDFTLVCHLVSGTTGTIRPTSLKFDVHIQKNSANFVALVVRTESDNDQSEETESDEEKSGFTSQAENQVSFSTSAFFSWVETASINSQQVTVLNSALSTDSGSSATNKKIVFSFPTAQTGLLTWDPKIGTKSDSLLVRASAFLVALLVLFTML